MHATDPLVVNIFSPSTLSAGEQGTWMANVSGGVGPYDYLWQTRLEGEIYWYNRGWSSGYTGSEPDDFDLRVIVTDAQASDQMNVTVTSHIE